MSSIELKDVSSNSSAPEEPDDDCDDAKQTLISDTQPASRSYRPDIDGLRAVAVVAVILYHIDHGLMQGGYLGVDMFFVVSGFVVTKSIHERPYTTWRSSLAEFYSRRIKRLTPALLTVIVCSTVLVLLFAERYPRNRVNHIMRTGLFACFASSNFDLSIDSVSYFNEGLELNFFTHMWSLGVEEQFYLTFPLLLVATGSLYSSGKRHAFVVLILILVCAFSLWFAVVAAPQDRFFLLQYRYWELGCGCILYYVLRYWTTTVSATIKVCVVATSVSFLYWVLYYNPFSDGEQPSPAVNVIACACTASLILVSPKEGNNRAIDSYLWVLSHPATQWIGKRSYTLYLCHWPLLVLMRYTMGVSWTTTSLFFLPTLSFSVVLIYKYIETRLRFAQWHKHAWGTILIGIGLCSCACAIVGLAFIPGLQAISFAGKQRNYPETSETYNSKCRTHFYSASDFTDETLKSVCGFTPQKLGSRVIVLGDSHAAKIHSSLSEVANGLRERFNSSTDYGAENMAYFYRYGCAFPSSQERCLPGYYRLLRVLNETIGSGDVLILSNRIENEIGVLESCADVNGVHDSFFCSTDVLKRIGDFVGKLNVIGDIVESHNASLLLIGITPVYPTDNTPLCSTEWFRPNVKTINCILNKKYELMRRKPLVDALESFVLSRPSSALQSVFDLMCPNENCYAFNASLNAFSVSDSGHPVDDSFRLFAPTIANKIESIYSK